MIAMGAAACEVVALSSAEIRELVAIGFRGLLNGRQQPALQVFEALSVLRPGETFPLIGRGLAHLASGRVNEALRVLDAALAMQPDDEDARVFLGMALNLANYEHHSRAVLAAVAQDPRDLPVARLARGLCGQLRRQSADDDQGARRAPIPSTT